MTYELSGAAEEYNLATSPSKTKVIAITGPEPVTQKFIIDNKVLKQVYTNLITFFLYYRLSYLGEIGLQHTLASFIEMNSIIVIAITNKTRKFLLLLSAVS